MTAQDSATGALVLSSAEDLGPVQIRSVANGRQIRIAEPLAERIAAIRAAAVSRLESSGPVYGVTTGMGDQSRFVLDPADRERHQATLMLGRAVGSWPWLSRRQARAALAVRLRTLLNGDAGVSIGLCQHLAALLNADVVPAIPATGLGSAGEIIALAHLGALVTGSGSALSPDGVTARPAHEALGAAGLSPFPLAVKEGVALLEGIPTTSALAVLASERARQLADWAAVVAGTGIAVIGASRDPYSPLLARGDAALAAALERIRAVAGADPAPRALQAPLSFRVLGPALAHLDRCSTALDAAVARALGGVTDSPAFLGSAFLGSAGFDGFDLAATLDALTVAACHLAETSAARLHRLLDDRVTGLPRQLTDSPGLHAGLVAVHKRAVGVLHRMRREAVPTCLGSVETSLGQEDVQSFSMDSARTVQSALGGLAQVLACELLGVHQAVLLGGRPGCLGADANRLLDAAAAALPAGTSDRPFGRDVDALLGLTPRR
ncbi:MAG: aromatic amino acid ammonia-lyase [Geodermatophilaceae bacterium]